MNSVASGEHWSEEDLPHPKGERKGTAILAITVPLACVLVSIAWAIAAYLIAREKRLAQVELARLEIEAKQQVAARMRADNAH